MRYPDLGSEKRTSEGNKAEYPKWESRVVVLVMLVERSSSRKRWEGDTLSLATEIPEKGSRTAGTQILSTV